MYLDYLYFYKVKFVTQEPHKPLAYFCKICGLLYLHVFSLIHSFFCD